MNKMLLSAALAGIAASGFAVSAQAADAPAKEKCYGVAKAGKNDCKAADGSHACMGLATKDNNAADWVNVEKGMCEKEGGKLAPAKK